MVQKVYPHHTVVRLNIFVVLDQEHRCNTISQRGYTCQDMMLMTTEDEDWDGDKPRLSSLRIQKNLSSIVRSSNGRLEQ